MTGVEQLSFALPIQQKVLALHHDSYSPALVA